MYCVGLTGAIGSGKSTVSSFFKDYGITIISADEIARELTAWNQPALHSIQAHFGDSVLDPSGGLNRAALRQIIFDDLKQRLWLEQLLHPLIRARIQEKIAEAKSPYCIIEIPLLTNRIDYPYLNRVLLVKTTLEQKIKRLMDRDNSSQEFILTVLAAQPDDSTRQKIADDTVINDGSLAKLSKKIEELHDVYLSLAPSHQE